MSFILVPFSFLLFTPQLFLHPINDDDTPAPGPSLSDFEVQIAHYRKVGYCGITRNVHVCLLFFIVSYVRRFFIYHFPRCVSLYRCKTRCPPCLLPPPSDGCGLTLSPSNRHSTPGPRNGCSRSRLICFVEVCCLSKIESFSIFIPS